MKNLTASDRSALIRLAASLPVGDENRRAILAGLVGAKTASADDAILQIIKARSKRKQGTTPSQLHYLHNIPLRDAVAAIESLERKGLITPDLSKPAPSRQAPEVEFFAKSAAATTPQDGMKVKAMGVTGKGLKDGVVYTLQAASPLNGLKTFNFMAKGKSVARFAEDAIERWLRSGSRGDQNGLVVAR